MAGKGEGQTILVVEDDPVIRANVRSCLKSLGYHALEAESGEAALEICNSTSTDIDLIMTDLVKPAMGGHELARRLQERFPELHVLFTSGYTADVAVRAELLQSGNSFLEKPYSVAALSDAVQEALVRQYECSGTELETAGSVGAATADGSKPGFNR
jgi:CheY-like chemotaxis protein